MYGLCSLGFAVTGSYGLAIVLLVVGGAGNLASMSIRQTVVQLRAPAADRGRVIGLYGVSASGLRAGISFTVGLLGAVIGVHWSLVCRPGPCAGTVAAAAYVLGGRRTAPSPA